MIYRDCSAGPVMLPVRAHCTYRCHPLQLLSRRARHDMSSRETSKTRAAPQGNQQDNTVAMTWDPPTDSWASLLAFT